MEFPDTCLCELRYRVDSLRELDYIQQLKVFVRIVELWEALDRHLTTSGQLPQSWHQAKPCPPPSDPVDLIDVV